MDDVMISETVSETVSETSSEISAGGLRSSSVALFPSTVVDGRIYIPAPAGIDVSVIQTLRDCLSGYVGDYVVFSYLDSEYILIRSDSLTYENGSFWANGFTAFDVVAVDRSEVVSRSVSGRLVGVGESPEVETFSGSYDDYMERPAYYHLFTDTFESTIQISNAQNAVIYSSFEGFAHLQDTSAYWLYYLAFAFSVFALSHLTFSIFRRVK